MSAESEASSIGWLRCNNDVGYITLDQAHSFSPVGSACAECSPGSYFNAIGQGVVYATVDADAVSTRYYYVTVQAPPLQIVPAGAIGTVQSLVVADTEVDAPRLREVWHIGGAIGFSLPRSWLKQSMTNANGASVLAGPTLRWEQIRWTAKVS